MQRVIFLSLFASGVVAAYLMLRRGESLETILHDSTQHPVSSLVRESRLAS